MGGCNIFIDKVIQDFLLYLTKLHTCVFERMGSGSEANIAKGIRQDVEFEIFIQEFWQKRFSKGEQLKLGWSTTEP